MLIIPIISYFRLRSEFIFITVSFNSIFVYQVMFNIFLLFVYTPLSLLCFLFFLHLDLLWHYRNSHIFSHFLPQFCASLASPFHMCIQPTTSLKAPQGKKSKDLLSTSLSIFLDLLSLWLFLPLCSSQYTTSVTFFSPLTFSNAISPQPPLKKITYFWRTTTWW